MKQQHRQNQRHKATNKNTTTMSDGNSDRMKQPPPVVPHGKDAHAVTSAATATPAPIDPPPMDTAVIA